MWWGCGPGTSGKSGQGRFLPWLHWAWDSPGAMAPLLDPKLKVGVSGHQSVLGSAGSSGREGWYLSAVVAYIGEVSLGG